MIDGRGILDLRGGTGGTGFVVDMESLLLLSELLDVETTRDLFNKPVWDIEVGSFNDGARRPVLTGRGGCGRALVRSGVVGFFNGVELGGELTLERFILNVAMDFVLTGLTDLLA